MLVAKYAAKRALNMSLRAKFMAGVMSSYFLCLQNGDKTCNAVSTYWQAMLIFRSSFTSGRSVHLFYDEISSYGNHYQLYLKIINCLI